MCDGRQHRGYFSFLQSKYGSVLYTWLAIAFIGRKLYNSIQENPVRKHGDELNADMSSSFGGKPRLLDRGGCH